MEEIERLAQLITDYGNTVNNSFVSIKGTELLIAIEIEKQRQIVEG